MGITPVSYYRGCVPVLLAQVPQYLIWRCTQGFFKKTARTPNTFRMRQDPLGTPSSPSRRRTRRRRDPDAKIHDSEMPEHQVRRDPEDPFLEGKSKPDERRR